MITITITNIATAAQFQARTYAVAVELLLQKLEADGVDCSAAMSQGVLGMLSNKGFKVTIEK